MIDCVKRRHPVAPWEQLRIHRKPSMACPAVELVLPACVRELEVNEEDVRAIVGRELREIDDRVCEFDEGLE